MALVNSVQTREVRGYTLLCNVRGRSRASATSRGDSPNWRWLGCPPSDLPNGKFASAEFVASFFRFRDLKWTISRFRRAANQVWSASFERVHGRLSS
jgi:hypothetical protein